MSENPPAAMRLTPWTSAVYGLGLFLLTFLLALLYQEAVVHSVTRWNTLGGSHAPLILAVSLYLIWIQREKLREMGPKPALLSGGLLLAAGCFVLFAGKISSTMLVQQISIVPVLLGLILVLGGFSYMTIFLLPIGYLLFLTGLVDHLLGEFSLFFQQTTAWLAAVLLALLGFSVFQEGTLIQLPHILLHVVRECNGVNQIMSLLALAVPLGYMTQRTWTRQIVLVMSALVIGLLINGLRVAMIGVYALYNHGADLHGPAGTLSAMVVFFFGLVVLIMFNMLLARIGRKHKSSPGLVPHLILPCLLKKGRAVLHLGSAWVLLPQPLSFWPAPTVWFTPLASAIPPRHIY